jgi:hypothetical protein
VRPSLRQTVGLWAALLLLLTACDALRQAPATGEGTGYVAPPGPDGGPGRSDLDILLVSRDQQVQPGNSSIIEIQVIPAGSYEVTLAVRGNGGAFLDRDRVVTDEEGRATAVLTVPTEDSALSVLAVVEGSTGELPISVGKAWATVVVEPQYSGERPVDEWIVQVLFDGSPCPDAIFEAEGEVFEVGAPIQFDDIPAARPVQVFARGGKYISGCAADVTLRPGLPNVIALPMRDRSLQLAGLEMHLRLSFTRTPELEGALSSLAEQMLTAFRAGLATDVEGLLYAMAEVYAVRAPRYGRSGFDVAATERGWVRAVEEHLAARNAATNPISATVRGWLDSGMMLVFSDEGFLFGTLTAEEDQGTLVARLLIDSLGPLSPRIAEVTASSNVVLVATSDDDDDDKVSVGFQLPIRPSRVLGELGKWSASVEALSDVPHALGAALDCTALGEELLARSDDQAEPLPECTPSCLNQVCNDALLWMWAQAEQAALSERPLDFLATGPAQIDSEARPLQLGGEWTGQAALMDDAEPIRLSGTFSAASTSESE